MKTIDGDMENKIDHQVIDVYSNIVDIFETVDLVFKQVQEPLRIAESLDQTINNSVQGIHCASEFLSDNISRLSNNIEFFDKNYKYWRNFQQQHEITEKEAINILKKYHWFVTPSLPFDFVYEVVKIGRNEGDQRTSVNKLFEDYFISNDFENLDAIVNEWAGISIFEPRMEIFEDCISALRDSKNITNPSNLIIPTLIAQIDGIQANFMELNNLSFDNNAHQWKNTNGTQVLPKSLFGEHFLNREHIDLSDQELLKLCSYTFFDLLFQKSGRGEPLSIPITFSRHKVMHGEYVDYGGIDNTIRAFMILDFLSTLTNRTLSKQQ